MRWSRAEEEAEEAAGLPPTATAESDRRHRRS